jgi:bifunctional non-homologous end joining protein LigD
MSARLRSEDLASLPEAPVPREFHAELATLVDEAPEGDVWLHEVKFDGYRIGCRIDRGKVQLITRNGKDWTAHFPEIVEAARRLAVERALFDGEVTILLDDGRTSFQALQNVFGEDSRRRVVYFVFDLLHLDGRDVARAPLEQRKRLLRQLLERKKSAGAIRYCDDFAGHGGEFLREACKKGLEGIVSKRRDLPYRPGRSPQWVKTKCVQRQEFVIGGFTDPEGSREGIGALLVGVYEHGTLAFAGKVGTGFTQKTSRELRRALEGVEQKDCPFVPRPPGSLGKNAHWVRPDLVAEVRFTEWTEDGKLRHPSFQGLRADKPATDVKRETPKALAATDVRTRRSKR